MLLDPTKNYDVISVLDIPSTDISDDLKAAIRSYTRYSDSSGGEHMYHPDDLLEAVSDKPEHADELEAISSICQTKKVMYFRITD